MVDQSVIELVREYLRQCQTAGLPVAKAVLYGSCARGTQRPESDIDVLLLSPAFEELTWDQETLAWKIARSVDWRIQPVLCGELTYETNDWHPLLDLARQDGLEIRPESEVPAPHP
jgi:predicted nucleotidyltransferase